MSNTPALPAPESPQAPKFWRFETGGELQPAIVRFLGGAPPSVRDVALIRAYFCQWIDSPAWDLNPHQDEAAAKELARLRREARQIHSAQAIHDWLGHAVTAGIDPL